uniref:ADP-ribosylhydrolase ARH3 n=1 Tax=Chlamydomonas leiostraca TaxID=1034604 RepID=A0A7S0WZG7_9CHLO
MGVLIGDALGLGCHWVYDLDTLKSEWGWVSDYTTPRKGRYHEGCKAGDVSQTGQVVEQLLRSVAGKGAYDQADFTARLDALLATLDGTAYGAQGGRYTDVAMRDVWRGRVREGKPWGQVASEGSDTSEAAQRAVVLAARYAGSLGQVGTTSMACAALTHADHVVAGQSMSLAILVAALIQGEALDARLSTRLREMAKTGELPITHAVLAEERATTHHVPSDPTPTMPFPDALLQMGWVTEAARDPSITIPPTKVGLVYGMACSIHFLLPAAYYLAAHYEKEATPAQHFEGAVLAAINAGGNNMARAALTGALVGAMVGASNIPQRFIDGLTNGRELLALAQQVATQAFPEDGSSA